MWGAQQLQDILKGRAEVEFYCTIVLKLSRSRLGSDRFARPYRERLDRPWSIDEDEDGPHYPD